MSRVTRGIRVPAIAAVVAAVCFVLLGFETPLAESGDGLPEWVKEKLSSPLTERDCVALALEFSYAMQKSEYDVKRAKGTHLTSVSAFLPNVSMGSGFQRRVTGPTDYSFFDPTSGRLITGLTEAKSNDTWYLDFSVRQNLINLSDWADLGQARHLLNSARMGYENWKQETEYTVVAQFYSLLKAIKLAEVAQESLELSKEQLRKAENLEAQGAGTRADVLKAKVRVSESSLELITATNRVDVEKARLLSVMGLPWTEGINISEELEVNLAEPDSAALWRSAMENRPDLRQGTFLKAAAKSAQTSARASRLPSISGSFAYSWSGDHAPDERSIVDKDYYWSVGARLSIPLFDGLYTKSRIRATSADYLKQQVEYEELKQQVALDLKEALLQYREARQRYIASQEGVEAADEDYRLSQEKFQLGSGTMLELITAEVSRVRAISSFIDAQSDMKIAEALLKKVSGR